MTDRHHNPHEALAESISDGNPIDWDQAETAPGVDAAMVRSLRDVERIARFSSQTQVAPFAGVPPSSAPSRMHPQRWGNLTLLELAGTGTRGQVWRAWDSTLQRQVALKFLQDTDGAGASEDLLQEARALARVHHPNVATVFGIAEYEGQAGMWMEFLGGSTLAAEIERTGPMTPREVARIGVSLCSALESLESAGLVHRDIKPANIALQPDGRVVLMDFGLGLRFTAPAESRSSGTPVFMAPEVLASGPPTPRSDLYALGVTLWWAAAGRPPFQASTLEKLKEEVARGPVPKLREANPAVPRTLAAAIEWAMNPDPEARPRGAAQLGASLSAVRPALGDRRRRKRRSVAFAAAGIAAVAAITLLLSGRVRHFVGGTTTPPVIAVLPVVNRTGDPGQEYMADGMTDELIAYFAQMGDLRVSAYPSVAAFKNSKLRIREIAKKLHARTVVATSVNVAGARMSMSATLVDAASEQAIWGHVYEGRAEDVHALERSLATSVADRLGVRLSAVERDHLRRGREVNPTARALYLRGLAAFRDQSSEATNRAIDYFRRAIAVDSTYADAWTRLAFAYDWASTSGNSDENRRLGNQAALRALEFDPGSGPARAIITTHRLYRDWDFVEGVKGYREALSLSPGDVDARIELVVCLTAMGRFDEASAEAKRARECDPLSSTAAAISLYPLFEGRRFGEAVRAAREILATDPNNVEASFILGQGLYFSGHRRDGIATVEQLMRTDPFPEGIAWLGLMRGLSGDEEGAHAALARLHQLDSQQRVDLYCFAIVHVGLGEEDAALAELRRLLDRGVGSSLFLRVDPALDPLRDDPRFQALTKRFRIES